MATLDGLRIIEADTVDSYLIRFTEKLNNITPTVFNYLAGTTSNIQNQINNIASTIFNSTTGFHFVDLNTIGFSVSNTTYNYLDINSNANSNITTPQLFINTGLGGVKFYSYKFTTYPAITLNQLNFEIYSDGNLGLNDYIRAYIKFIASDIENVNMKCSNIIESNIIQRNLDANNGGFCELFTNAETLDAIIIGSTVSNTYMQGITHGITKDMVGLDLVDNTTDLDKPISTDTQTALDLKANLINPIFTNLTSDSITVNGATGLDTKLIHLSNTTSSVCYSESKISNENLRISSRNGLTSVATGIYFDLNTTNNTLINSLMLTPSEVKIYVPLFKIVDNTNITIFEIISNGTSTLTTQELNMNSSLNIYSYDYSTYPSLLLNKKVFEVFTNKTDGSTDYVKSYVPFTSTDIISDTILTEFSEAYQLKITDKILCNIIQKATDINTGGELKLFDNASLDDNIIIGSSVSTTSMSGQALNVLCDLSTFSNPVVFSDSIELQSIYSVAPTSTMLGYTVNFSHFITGISNTTQNLVSCDIPVGIWNICYSIIIDFTGTTNIISQNILFANSASSTTPINNFCGQLRNHISHNYSSGQQIVISNSFTYSNLSALTTIYLNSKVTYTGSNFDYSSYVQLCRIA